LRIGNPTWWVSSCLPDCAVRNSKLTFAGRIASGCRRHSSILLAVLLEIPGGAARSS
jgi:hypothetical protein